MPILDVKPRPPRSLARAVESRGRVAGRGSHCSNSLEEGAGRLRRAKPGVAARVEEAEDLLALGAAGLLQRGAGRGGGGAGRTGSGATRVREENDALGRGARLPAVCPRAWAGEREAGQRHRSVGMEVGLPKGHEVTPIHASAIHSGPTVLQAPGREPGSEHP